MTQILTGKQVLVLLGQDEEPEIEFFSYNLGKWVTFHSCLWHVDELRTSIVMFRIKSKPRLSVTIAEGEVVNWPEPVREALKEGQEYWFIDHDGVIEKCEWDGGSFDKLNLAFGNIHLTEEAAQEHADALRKINTQAAS